jgi:hypothetical protein
VAVTRGTSNTNARGSSEDRRRRRRFLLETFGDGTTALCSFDDCTILLTFETVTVDRILPGALGGRYTRDNIRPACGPHNFSDGATKVKEQVRKMRSETPV